MTASGELEDVLGAALGEPAVLLSRRPGPYASSFWLDPTHKRPIPPLLLQFVVRARGFVDVEIRPLHPVRRDAVDPLEAALYGPQDYAVVARTARPVDEGAAESAS